MNKILRLPFRFCYERRSEKTGDTKKKTCWERSTFYSNFIRKRPWYIATFLPILLVWAAWFPCMESFRLWNLYLDRYTLVACMFVASGLASFLSQGTGGLSFPVMTLLFGIAPQTARDFALLSQAVVLSGSGFAIIYQKVPLEKNAILFASFGGAFGSVFALQWVAPMVSESQSVIAFVSLWVGFGAAVFWLSRETSSEAHLEMPNWSNWKALILMVTGFCGGVLTALFGTGQDLSVFSCLVLLFRISANTAAPTGVIIQMINSVVVVVVEFKPFFMSGLQQPALVDWIACLPFVSVGAPLGTFCLSFVYRMGPQMAFYLVNLTQFVYAILVMPIDTGLIFIVVVVTAMSSGFWLLLAKLSEKLVDVESKGYVFDDEPLLEDYNMSYESLPSLEELREGKKNMERLEKGSPQPAAEGHDIEWSPYGRRANSIASATENDHLLGTKNSERSY